MSRSFCFSGIFMRSCLIVVEHGLPGRFLHADGKLPRSQGDWIRLVVKVIDDIAGA